MTPIGPTEKSRMILLLSYDQQPEMSFTEELQASVRYPTAGPHLGLPVPS